MMSYLDPADRPVIDGLEKYEIVMAERQPQFRPLRSLRGENNEGRLLSRWSPTEEQRQAIAAGADIFLELMTFGQPLQPITMMVSDGLDQERYKNDYNLSLPKKVDDGRKKEFSDCF